MRFVFVLTFLLAVQIPPSVSADGPVFCEVFSPPPEGCEDCDPSTPLNDLIVRGRQCVEMIVGMIPHEALENILP